MATLIKVDRNGSKHFEGMVKCDRCGGTGTYVWGAIINGNPQYAGVCFKCDGVGQVFSKWIERTPEYQAKLDAKREAKYKAQAEAIAKAQAEAEAKAEAERLAKEAEEKARKAVSKYVGTIGDKFSAQVTYTGSAHYEVDAYRGYGKDTVYIHMFTDAEGNKIVWKTSSSLGKWVENDWCGYEDGDTVMLTGTIKEHKEYRDEKQTVLTRCKVKGVK